MAKQTKRMSYEKTSVQKEIVIRAAQNANWFKSITDDERKDFIYELMSGYCKDCYRPLEDNEVCYCMDVRLL